MFSIRYRFSAVELDNRFYVNPGSATGAWTGSYNGCVTPSVLILVLCLDKRILTCDRQRCHTLVRSDGHTGSSRGDLCLPADRRRGPRRQSRISQGGGTCPQRASTSLNCKKRRHAAEHTEQSWTQQSHCVG